jgi:hypothetical protein
LIETQSPDPGSGFLICFQGGFGDFYFSMKVNMLLSTWSTEMMNLIWVQQQQNQNNEGPGPTMRFWQPLLTFKEKVAPSGVWGGKTAKKARQVSVGLFLWSENQKSQHKTKPHIFSIASPQSPSKEKGSESGSLACCQQQSRHKICKIKYKICRASKRKSPAGRAGFESMF